MPFEAGDLILANYTAKIKDTGEPVETTVSEEAVKLEIHDPTRKYEPRLISVGRGWMLQGVDEALRSTSVGERVTIDVPPEKGFGLRNPDMVKLIPLKKLGERAKELRVEDVVEVDGRVGIVRFIGSGRVQVDFNHRFAGKTLTYEIEVVKKLEGDHEKAVAIIRRRLPIDEGRLALTFEDEALKIQLPPESYLTEGLQIVKRAVSNDIFEFIQRVRKVHFIEVYETSKPKEEPKPEPPQPEAPRPEQQPEAPQQVTPEQEAP